MNIPSVDIKDILESISSLALTFATDLFIGSEPGTPDNCVVIFDAPGAPPEITLEGSAGLYYPVIQIRVRNRSYVAAANLINQIKDVLHGLNNEVWNNTMYLAIVCMGEPFLLDWDSNKRARFVCDFRLIRR